MNLSKFEPDMFDSDDIRKKVQQNAEYRKEMNKNLHCFWVLLFIIGLFFLFLFSI